MWKTRACVGQKCWLWGKQKLEGGDVPHLGLEARFGDCLRLPAQVFHAKTGRHLGPLEARRTQVWFGGHKILPLGGASMKATPHETFHGQEIWAGLDLAKKSFEAA